MTALSAGAASPLGLTGREERFTSVIDRLIYLRGLADLSHVKGGDLRIIAQNATERFFPAGAYLQQQGRCPEAMHFILEGEVDISRDGVVHQTCAAPDGVGFIPLLSRDPDGVDAVAVVDTLTLEIPADTMLELIEDNFEFMLAALKGLSNALASTQEKLERRGLLQRSVPEAGPYPEAPLDIVQRLARLRVGPYADVNLEPLIELSRLAEEIRLEPGETLWRQGDPSPYGLTIIHGVVRCATQDGTRVFRMGCDSVVGYLEAHAGKPRTYDAVTETRLVAIKGMVEDYYDVLEDHQEVGVAFLQFIANIITRLRTTAARAEAAGMTMESGG